MVPTTTNTFSIDDNIGISMIRVPADNIYKVFLTLNLFKTIIDKFSSDTVMYLDIIIRRSIAFVGCMVMIAATELSQILRSLFIALQRRRRCISSSISFDSHLVHIRWFIGVIGLLYRPHSIFKSCELIRYLAIAVMRWFHFIFKIYGPTHKYVLIK